MKSPIENLKEELSHTRGVPHNKKIIKDTSLVNEPALDLVPPEEAKKAAQEIPKNKFITTLFYASLIFLVVVFLYMVYSYKIADTIISNKKIEVHVVTPTQIVSGKDAIFKVSLSNENKTALMKPEIVTTIEEINQSKTVPLLEKYEKEVRIAITDVQSNAVTSQDIPVLFVGSEGKRFLVQSQLQYSLPDSVARFTKEIFLQEVVITQNPVAIVPKVSGLTVVEGQEYQTSFTIENNNSEDFENIALRISVPEGVTQTIKEIKSFEGGNIYPIGSLKQKELQNLNLTGVVNPEAPDVSTITIEVVSLASFGSEEIESVLSKNSINLTKQKPFLTTRLDATNSIVTVVPLRDITTTFTVKNNYKEDLQNIEIKLTSTGEIISSTSLDSDAAASVGTGEIVFNKFTDERLAQLRVGESITLPIKFTSSPIVTGNLLTENPESVLIANVTAQTMALDTLTLEDYQVGKVQGQTLAELTFATIPSEKGTFTEAGPFPFIVGRTSTVITKFTLKNTSNTLTGGKVTFKLPYYVSFGLNKSVGENVYYNDVERSITWNFGELPAGTGIVEGSARELTITLLVTPVVAHVSQTIPLTSDVTLSGTDSLTQKNIAVKRPSLKANYDGASEDQLKVQRK